MTENIYDIANHLERTIRALPEYKAVQQAKEAILADAPSKKTWEAFIASQSKLQALMQAGQMPSKDEQDEMTQLGQAISQNPLLSTYFDKQQLLSVYIQDIEKIVFSPLQDLAN